MIKKHNFKIEYVILAVMTICFIIGIKLIPKNIDTKSYDDDGNLIELLNMPIEEVGRNDDIWFYMAGSDNRGISRDIVETEFDGDDTVYFIVPKDFDNKHVIFYVRDGYDQYCTKIEADFSEGPIKVGNKTVDLRYTDFPILQIKMDKNSPSFNDICGNGEGEISGFGSATLDTTKEYSNKYGCHQNFKIKNSDNNSLNIALSPRGNVTWCLDKHPFTIAFDEAISILGMKKHKKYNLIANAKDKSLLKNTVCYELADELGLKHTCERRFISLYVNGNYQGVYLLTSKMRVGKNEINLDKDDWLLNWGGTDFEQPIFYDSDMEWIDSISEFPYIDLVYPENDPDINSKREFIQKMVDAIEDVSSDEYLNYIDLESFVKFYWVQEFTMNLDADFRSIYMYYDHNDTKIHAGPIWDMDSTFGALDNRYNVDLSNPIGWKIREFSWIKYLYQHDSFMKACDDYYYDVFQAAMHNTRDSFEHHVNEMQSDGQLDMDKWGNEAIDTISYETDSYNEWCDGILGFIDSRIAFIEADMDR